MTDLAETIDRLLYESEGPALDFKREEYPFVGVNKDEKSELLKDILAFANAWRRAEAFILIGVEEQKGSKAKVVGVSTLLSDASVQQFVNSLTQRPIECSCCALTVEGKAVDVVRIPVQQRPFFLRRNYGRLKSNVVYVRRGSSTAEADPAEIVLMGASQTGDSKAPSLSIFLVSGEDSEQELTSAQLKTTRILLPADSEIPDNATYIAGFHGVAFKMPSLDDEEYYRQFASFLRDRFGHAAIRIGVKNTGPSVATDVRLELSLAGPSGSDLSVIEEMPEPPDRTSRLAAFLQSSFPSERAFGVSRRHDGFTAVCSLGKIQAGGHAFSDRLFIGASTTCSIAVSVRLLCDELEKPLESALTCEVEVLERKVGVEALVRLADRR